MNKLSQDIIEEIEIKKKLLRIPGAKKLLRHVIDELETRGPFSQVSLNLKNRVTELLGNVPGVDLEFENLLLYILKEFGVKKFKLSPSVISSSLKLIKYVSALANSPSNMYLLEFGGELSNFDMSVCIRQLENYYFKRPLYIVPDDEILNLSYMNYYSLEKLLHEQYYVLSVFNLQKILNEKNFDNLFYEKVSPRIVEYNDLLITLLNLIQNVGCEKILHDSNLLKLFMLKLETYCAEVLIDSNFSFCIKNLLGGKSRGINSLSELYDFESTMIDIYNTTGYNSEIVVPKSSDDEVTLNYLFDQLHYYFSWLLIIEQILLIDRVYGRKFIKKYYHLHSYFFIGFFK